MRFVLAIASIVALASCSGGNTQPVNEGCPLMLPAPPPVLYPASASPLASTGGFDVITGYQYGQYALLLEAPGAPTVATAVAAPAPTPLPPGAGTPPPGAIPVAYAVPPASLQPGATYSIVAMLTFPGDCPTQMPTLGTFTTAP